MDRNQRLQSISYSAAVVPHHRTPQPSLSVVELVELSQKSFFWRHSWLWDTVCTHPRIFRLHLMWFKASQSTTSPKWSNVFQSRFKIFSVLKVVINKARSLQQSLVNFHRSNLWQGTWQKSNLLSSTSSTLLSKDLNSLKCPQNQHWANPYFKSKRIVTPKMQNIVLNASIISVLV